MAVGPDRGRVWSDRSACAHSAIVHTPDRATRGERNSWEYAGANLNRRFLCGRQ